MKFILTKCKDCIYWEPIKGTHLRGECRFFPPHAPRKGLTFSQFPVVEEKDWCSRGRAGERKFIDDKD